MIDINPLSALACKVTSSINLAQEFVSGGFLALKTHFWLEQLKTTMPESREEAAAKLGEILYHHYDKFREALPHALRNSYLERAWVSLSMSAQSDPSPHVRRAMIEAMAGVLRHDNKISNELSLGVDRHALGSEAIRRRLADDPEALVRERAAWLLRESNDANNQHTLVRALYDQIPVVMCAAANSLSISLGRSSDTLVQSQLISIIRRAPEYNVRLFREERRKCALFALSNVKTEAVDALISGIIADTSENSAMRVEALNIIETRLERFKQPIFSIAFSELTDPGLKNKALRLLNKTK